jgi:DNA polymerase-3 subunit beta
MLILRDPLRDALALVSKAAGSGSTLPILACVDLQAEKDSLTLTANNLEMVIRTRISAQAQAPFSAAVPAAVLTSIVSASDADTIDLDFDQATLTMKVASGGAKSKIKTLPQDEFPLVPDADILLGRLPAQALKTALKRVVIAASLDVARPALNGVQLAKLGNDVYLAAADGFRLAAYRLETPLEFPEKHTSLVIPRQAAIKLTQVLPDDGEMVSIFVSKNASAILFTWQTTSVWAQLVDIAFPDWQQIVPSGFKHTLNLPGKDAVAALNRADVFAREANHVVRFKPGEEGGLVIEGASDETGKSETVLDVAMPFQIAFNSVFAKQGVEAIGADAVHLHLNAVNAPAMFTNGTNRYIYVLMPMVDPESVAAQATAAAQSETA